MAKMSGRNSLSSDQEGVGLGHTTVQAVVSRDHMLVPGADVGGNICPHNLRGLAGGLDPSLPVPSLAHQSPLISVTQDGCRVAEGVAG